MMDGTRRVVEYGGANGGEGGGGDDVAGNESHGPTTISSFDTPRVTIGLGGRYPMATHFHFSPGGISYTAEPSELITVSTLSNDPKRKAEVIDAAKRADDSLREFSLLYAYRHHNNEMSDSTVGNTTTEQIAEHTPHFLPSLSVLAETVFGRLTGCAPDHVKSWADAMILSQWNDADQLSSKKLPEFVPTTEDDIVNKKPKAITAEDDLKLPSSQNATLADSNNLTPSVATMLKQVHKSYEEQTETSRRPRRPCGYVFKRGDIAWNCRTCQTDPTCVICDDCFRNSDHDGHEVYFHRTTPGGCCDCGDIEAWMITGCCDQHRPIIPSYQSDPVNGNTADVMMTNDDSNNLPASPPLFGLDDPMEAVRSANTALSWAVETLTSDPAAQLPPRLRAALGVVIGAGVQCIIDAVDGSGVGADAVQWTKRWADEAAHVANNAPYNEDYYYWPLSTQDSPSNKSTAEPATMKSYSVFNKNFPDHLRLHLRLHNDDVHTFDEVIDALHEPRHIRRPVDMDDPISAPQQFASLVSLRENATEMTHHVDSDGQVTVKTYNNIASALRGFRRLKSRGLHCAVVSTAQVDLELRARAMCAWLTELASSHPVAQALIVHALVQIPASHGTSKPTSSHGDLVGAYTWHPCRMIPPWSAILNGGRPNDDASMLMVCQKRFVAFPPHLPSSYLTREEAELLHGMAIVAVNSNPAFSADLEGGLHHFVQLTGTRPEFYSNVPYRLPSQRYHKSPHALWGTLPSQYLDPWPMQSKHPLLGRLVSGLQHPSDLINRLTESVYVVDTDLRKQQEGERITTSVFPHKLPGLNMISGMGTIKVAELSARRPPLPSPMDLRHLLVTSSFRAPLSPIMLLLLLDPYPTKQVRGAIHTLFLSLLANSRFKTRFAGALAVAYRPLSTLFCAGIGTEADTPLHFTVQIFTAGSLVRALCYGPAIERLLACDQEEVFVQDSNQTSIGIFVPPIAHVIVRCIHTNLLGSTKEVNMILNNTISGSDDNSQEEGFHHGNVALLPSLTYVAGEHSLMTPLPAAPDDGFLDSRSMRHKRLPHLLRDLDYVIETPGTAVRLLLPSRFPVYQGPSLSFRGDDVLSFSAVFARMLRLAQGMDPQKRKISGGHVEYEQQRWLEAFGLSLNFGGTRDAIAESPGGTIFGTSSNGSDVSHVFIIREAMGNIIASLLREVKLWLYREGLLETGLPIPSSGGNAATDLAQVEALQRSTLHATSTQYDTESQTSPEGGSWSSSSIALSCATGVKMTEIQLTLIENALKVEAAQRQEHTSKSLISNQSKVIPASGPVLGEWLRVPHSPLAGDSLSFHLPLHRALAKCIKSICSMAVPEEFISAKANDWWKIPILDDSPTSDPSNHILNHPLVPLIRSTLRTSNCKVVWSSGPDCTPQEAQRRRSRSRALSANIAVAKILHSLADHPIRCLAASQQIERHLWTRNGSSVAGMAMNYSSAPLCRSFRDLDLLLVQLSAAGMNCGLGARRIFVLLLSRFSLDGYLCDPERRTNSGGTNTFPSSLNMWVNPPRLQDSDHATILAESFFSTLCVIVTELPLRPPKSASDDKILQQSIRRELLHALATEPRTHSEAMAAASCGLSKREESEGATGKGGGGGLFRGAFTAVLKEIGKQKTQNASRTSGPPVFELKPQFCDEYDPTFFHLRRQEHQHAMDVVARLRKQKWGEDKDALETHCLPIVCAPPKAHPRFLPCRLLLHLDSVDAALRRALLFALTNGSWIPPLEPMKVVDDDDLQDPGDDTKRMIAVIDPSETPVRIINRRMYQSHSVSSFTKKKGASNPFSSEVVATSSVSFLEVLQLLTLQVHTLEECASLHMECLDLDDEARALSASLSINSFLSRLVYVPDSLVDIWAFRPFPFGPLKSRGSGEKRGSILGFLIVIYEHRADHGPGSEEEAGEYGGKSDDLGGARTLVSSGLKWLLRVVHALVTGASSLSLAIKSATTGVPVTLNTSKSQFDTISNVWTINEAVRSTISGMLHNLVDLWPNPRSSAASPDKSNAKSKEARKAAQQRVMDMMKRKQAAFAETIGGSPTTINVDMEVSDQESDLCIICRCDDADGENNGPLGYLGHVQRSRMALMRSRHEYRERDQGKCTLVNSYRVVGHMGCQLRETEAMDSKPIYCIPKGSVVTILKSKVAPQFDILSRRVFVQYSSHDPLTKAAKIVEGWASVQSSQGYVILSPLNVLCNNNTKWGGTRPVLKQCGHAAHTRCVETHMLSLHQRAAGEQPYDGRFAANINDGEFLCPLCKQLSNILIPRDSFPTSVASVKSQNVAHKALQSDGSLRPLFDGMTMHSVSVSKLNRTALEEFGTQLYNAMCVPWERSSSGKLKHGRWHDKIQKWDLEDSSDASYPPVFVLNLMRLLRQQLISWAAFGHSAAALEGASRGVEVVLPFGSISETTDPWPDYTSTTMNSHPMLLELKRNLTGSSGLLEILLVKMVELYPGEGMTGSDSFYLSTCLADILDGTALAVASEKSHVRTDWGCASALTAAIPCHVARDGMVPLSSDARAAAAALWAMKGHTTADYPVPLTVRQFLVSDSTLQGVPTMRGTHCPYQNTKNSQQSAIPYLPGVACGFLYTPFLSWDLCTLSGAVMSCILCTNDNALITSNQILSLTHVLLIGRMVQAIVTPGGIEASDEMEVDDCWTANEIDLEGFAVTKLYAHCRELVRSNCVPGTEEVSVTTANMSGPALLAGVGKAILPFARSLVLMLRACTAIIRERRGVYTGSADETEFDKILNSGLIDPELMTKEDGFHFVKAFNCPLPSILLNGEWFDLINRWLTTVIGLERHHHLMRKCMVPTSSTAAAKSETVTSASDVANGELYRFHSPMKSEDSSEDNMVVDPDADNDNENDDDDRSFRLELPDPFSPAVDMDDSDELADSMDDDEEMISFDNLPVLAGLRSRLPGSTSINHLDEGDVSDSSTENADVEYSPTDIAFANVSNAPIIPHQPSLLGTIGVGLGRNGSSFDCTSVFDVVADMSHLGSIHRSDGPTFNLIRLPKSFVELYNLVNKLNGRENDQSAMGEETDDIGTTETSICLLTGTVMRSGSTRRNYARATRPPGACTIHARKNASGVGIFFLVQKCTVLLMHNNKSAYSPSLYVDEHGEEDPQLKRGLPLYLNEARYRALELLWRQQCIPREVAQIRSTSDRVIRDNWY